MTTIAAKRNNGQVVIAWDSQSTLGNTASLNSQKVVAVNDQFAVGVGGLVRYSNIVHRASVDMIHPYDLAQPEFDAYGWLIEILVPSWGHALKKAFSQVPEDLDGENPWGHALIALAGGIYKIGGDFSVVDCGDFGAIGSGASFAQAAMHLGKSAKQAVQVASELDLYTGGEIKEMKV